MITEFDAIPIFMVKIRGININTKREKNHESN